MMNNCGTISATSAAATTKAPKPAGDGEETRRFNIKFKNSIRSDPYCKCGVDKFGFPAGWKYNDIWLDVVVILDTSEAMDASSLADVRKKFSHNITTKSQAGDSKIALFSKNWSVQVGYPWLFQATGLVESFIGDANDNVDFLITDTTAPFYSRVGVIAMADTAQVGY